MRAITKTILALAASGVLSFGQVSKSQGYVFQGFGTSGIDSNTATGHTGVGGEGVFWKGISVGGDIGALYSLRCPCVIGIGNLGGGYHYNAGRVDKKWEPFATAGYSLYFVSSDAASGFHYGGGTVYWFKPRLGLRLEVRDHWIERYHGFTEFRIGLSFR